MKVKKELVSRQWRVSNSKLKKGLYINVGIPKVDNKGFEIRFGYGYVEELKKYNEDPINTIKNIIKNFPLSLTKEEAREKLNELFKNENVEEKEVKEKYHGLDLIENIFNYFDIFKNCKDSKSKSLKDVVIHQIYQKFKLPMSIYGTYKSIKKET
ncbi:IS1634 family transposase, partial [Mycoplasmopsis mucosicanis]